MAKIQALPSTPAKFVAKTTWVSEELPGDPAIVFVGRRSNVTVGNGLSSASNDLPKDPAIISVGRPSNVTVGNRLYSDVVQDNTVKDVLDIQVTQPTTDIPTSDLLQPESAEPKVARKKNKKLNQKERRAREAETRRTLYSDIPVAFVDGLRPKQRVAGKGLFDQALVLDTTS